MKGTVTFATISALLVSVTGCAAGNGEPKSPPANAVHVVLVNDNTKTALHDLETRLDSMTNKGHINTISPNALSTLSQDTIPMPGKKPQSVSEDIAWLRAPDSGIDDSNLKRDIGNLESLFEMAKQYKSPDALNYMDKLTAELNFAANLKGGRYYGLSHTEGHGKEIDSFISQ